MSGNTFSSTLRSIGRKVLPAGTRRALRYAINPRTKGAATGQTENLKKVVILDTWVNDTNLGNKFIMEAVCNELRDLFPHSFIYQVPALEYVRAGRQLIEQADFVFLAGTNLLSSDMNKTSEWRLRLSDILWMRNVILMGVGWWQYQNFTPNLYTRILLKGVLSKTYIHSVRDSYTAARVKALGLKVLNTGCPTLWGLTKEHCAEIPESKSENALLTFTEYNQKPSEDRLLFEIVARNYEVVYFWPQMYGDYHYAKTICGKEVVFIDPSIEALDDLLRREAVDYVGTRLHAGIRALQHKRRAIIVGVDNRAIEAAKDFNLPVVNRERVALELEAKIQSFWKTNISLDQEAIFAWKNQFLASNKVEDSA